MLLTAIIGVLSLRFKYAYAYAENCFTCMPQLFESDWALGCVATAHTGMI